MIYRLTGGKSRHKTELFVKPFSAKSTVAGHKRVYVREKSRSSFSILVCSAGVFCVSLLFSFLTKKEGHGVHRESLDYPAP